MRILSGDLFVSAVEGRMVSRFGSGSATVKEQQIGVYPETEELSTGEVSFTGMRWDLDEVVRIPRAEYLKHLRAYDQELGAESLRLRTEADYTAWVAKQSAASASVKKKES